MLDVLEEVVPKHHMASGHLWTITNIIAIRHLWTEGSLASPAMSGSAPCTECKRWPRLISIL